MISLAKTRRVRRTLKPGTPALALTSPRGRGSGEKLQEAMQTSHLYRDNRLTLPGLCQQIKENPHYVSQVINQDLGNSFYDLVNLHRVENASGCWSGRLRKR